MILWIFPFLEKNNSTFSKQPIRSDMHELSKIDFELQFFFATEKIYRDNEKYHFL